tara:strand:- start:2256 stop:3446 length:1191 start_codon:yes stop_codon:yes gene_type:complete
MSFMTLPRISRAWAAAIIAVFLIVGVLALLTVSPREKSESVSVSLGSTQPSPLQKAVKEIEKQDVKGDVEKETDAVENPEGKGLQSDLIEEVVAPSDPLVLSKDAAEKADVINIKQEELEQEKPKSTPYYRAPYYRAPYYRAECLEEKGEGVFLPIKSSEGLRPFDAYQSEGIPPGKKTALTLVISELGANPKLFEQVKSSFPKEVACAFLANRELSQKLNNKARELGYETLLMLPMEPMTYPNSDPGPSTLLTNLPKAENLKRFEKSLGQFTGYIGVTPYMGSRFARVKRDFHPILTEVQRRGLLYFEPRLIRSKAFEIKPEKMLWAKAQYDIERGMSSAKIREILGRVGATLSKKKSVILTVQADGVSLKKIKKWLSSILKKDVVLTPLSSMTQ